MLELILGGARSGKSRRAEQVATSKSAEGRRVVYIATAQAHDREMEDRIEQHQQRRPATWQTVESPIELAKSIEQHNHPDNIILVDCLTLWLSNLLCHPDQSIFLKEKQNLLQTLEKNCTDVVLVSNETGLGVIPMGELTRRFVDEAGFLHQRIAEKADRVVFMVAGLPHILKESS